MKTYKNLFIFTAVSLAFLFFVGQAQAATLNQTNISLSVGQSSVIYATNVVSYLYISNNSNSSVATVSVGSANSINVYATSFGSDTVSICDGSYGCNSLYINVNSNGSNYNNSSLSLSQTNLSLSVGQTSTVTAYNAYGSYGTLYISNNSNYGVATATVSGNAVYIYGNSTGSTTITVCQSYNQSSCGYIYVTVGGGYGYNNTGNGLNISNFTLSVGSSVTISPSTNYNYNYNYSNTGLYVSSNSNPGVATATTSSNIPGCYVGYLYSITTGQPCTSPLLYNNNYNNNLYIPGCYAGYQYSITTGQPCNGGINGGGGSIVVTAVSVGNDTLTLCQSGGTCNSIYVTVTGYATPVNSYYSMPYSYYNNGNSSYPYYDNENSSVSGVPVVHSSSSAY